MTQDYRPPDKTVLEQYLKAFNGDTQYEIRHVKPATLVVSQNTIEELEKDRKASGKSEIPCFERSPVKSKGKEIKEEEPESVKELTQVFREMKIELAKQISDMKNQPIQME